MTAKLSIASLLIVSSSIAFIGCDSGSLERERAARVAAEQKAEAERIQREQERLQHVKKESHLVTYVMGTAFIAVILLFVGAGLGSRARNQAIRTTNANRNMDVH